MNEREIEKNVQDVIKNFVQDTFIYNLLAAYDTPRATVKRLKDGALNLAKIEGEIIWKKKLFFKPIEKIDDINAIFELAKSYAPALKNDTRFVVVTNYDTFLALDKKTGDALDISFVELPKHSDFFLPWAGMEKAQAKIENPADVKAAYTMAKLYDEIRKNNTLDTPEAVHSLNVFLSRLLFCFFAEDTKIFPKENQFSEAIKSHTQEDGSDLQQYLERNFDILNSPNRDGLPHYLAAFPYVNGGLFKEKYPIPVFSKKSRDILIKSGIEQNWSEINPDIFGSMIQAVVTVEHRGGLGTLV